MWGKVIDTGWFEWDIAVYCDWGLILKIVTAQEEHGQGKRLIRIRYCLGPTASMKALALFSVVAFAVGVVPYPTATIAAAGLSLVLGVRAWRRGLVAASRVIALFGTEAQRLQMIACSTVSQPASRFDEIQQ